MERLLVLENGLDSDVIQFKTLNSSSVFTEFENNKHIKKIGVQDSLFVINGNVSVGDDNGTLQQPTASLLINGSLRLKSSVSENIILGDSEIKRDSHGILDINGVRFSGRNISPSVIGSEKDVFDVNVLSDSGGGYDEWQTSSGFVGISFLLESGLHDFRFYINNSSGLSGAEEFSVDVSSSSQKWFNVSIFDKVLYLNGISHIFNTELKFFGITGNLKYTSLKISDSPVIKVDNVSNNHSLFNLENSDISVEKYFTLQNEQEYAFNFTQPCIVKFIMDTGNYIEVDLLPNYIEFGSIKPSFDANGDLLLYVIRKDDYTTVVVLPRDLNIVACNAITSGTFSKTEVSEDLSIISIEEDWTKINAPMFKNVSSDIYTQSIEFKESETVINELEILSFEDNLTLNGVEFMFENNFIEIGDLFVNKNINFDDSITTPDDEDYILVFLKNRKWLITRDGFPFNLRYSSTKDTSKSKSIVSEFNSLKIENLEVVTFNGEIYDDFTSFGQLKIYKNITPPNEELTTLQPPPPSSQFIHVILNENHWLLINPEEDFLLNFVSQRLNVGHTFGDAISAKDSQLHNYKPASFHDISHLTQRLDIGIGIGIGVNEQDCMLSLNNEDFVINEGNFVSFGDSIIPIQVKINAQEQVIIKGLQEYVLNFQIGIEDSARYMIFIITNDSVSVQRNELLNSSQMDLLINTLSSGESVVNGYYCVAIIGEIPEINQNDKDKLRRIGLWKLSENKANVRNYSNDPDSSDPLLLTRNKYIAILPDNVASSTPIEVWGDRISYWHKKNIDSAYKTSIKGLSFQPNKIVSRGSLTVDKFDNSVIFELRGMDGKINSDQIASTFGTEHFNDGFFDWEKIHDTAITTDFIFDGLLTLQKVNPLIVDGKEIIQSKCLIHFDNADLGTFVGRNFAGDGSKVTDIHGSIFVGNANVPLRRSIHFNKLNLVADEFLSYITEGHITFIYETIDSKKIKHIELGTDVNGIFTNVLIGSGYGVTDVVISPFSKIPLSKFKINEINDLSHITMTKTLTPENDSVLSIDTTLKHINIHDKFTLLSKISGESFADESIEITYISDEALERINQDNFQNIFKILETSVITFKDLTVTGSVGSGLLIGDSDLTNVNIDVDKSIFLQKFVANPLSIISRGVFKAPDQLNNTFEVEVDMIIARSKKHIPPPITTESDEEEATGDLTEEEVWIKNYLDHYNIDSLEEYIEITKGLKPYKLIIQGKLEGITNSGNTSANIKISSSNIISEIVNPINGSISVEFIDSDLINDLKTSKLEGTNDWNLSDNQFSSLEIHEENIVTVNSSSLIEQLEIENRNNNIENNTFYSRIMREKVDDVIVQTRIPVFADNSVQERNIADLSITNSKFSDKKIAFFKFSFDEDETEMANQKEQLEEMYLSSFEKENLKTISFKNNDITSYNFQNGAISSNQLANFSVNATNSDLSLWTMTRTAIFADETPEGTTLLFQPTTVETTHSAQFNHKLEAHKKIEARTLIGDGSGLVNIQYFSNRTLDFSNEDNLVVLSRASLTNFNNNSDINVTINPTANLVINGDLKSGNNSIIDIQMQGYYIGSAARDLRDQYDLYRHVDLLSLDEYHLQLHKNFTDFYFYLCASNIIPSTVEHIKNSDILSDIIFSDYSTVYNKPDTLNPYIDDATYKSSRNHHSYNEFDKIDFAEEKWIRSKHINNKTGIRFKTLGLETTPHVSIVQAKYNEAQSFISHGETYSPFKQDIILRKDTALTTFDFNQIQFAPGADTRKFREYVLNFNTDYPTPEEIYKSFQKAETELIYTYVSFPIIHKSVYLTQTESLSGMLHHKHKIYDMSDYGINETLCRVSFNLGYLHSETQTQRPISVVIAFGNVSIWFNRDMESSKDNGIFLIYHDDAIKLKANESILLGEETVNLSDMSDFEDVINANKINIKYTKILSRTEFKNQNKIDLFFCLRKNRKILVNVDNQFLFGNLSNDKYVFECKNIELSLLSKGSDYVISDYQTSVYDITATRQDFRVDRTYSGTAVNNDLVSIYEGNDPVFKQPVRTLFTDLTLSYYSGYRFSSQFYFDTQENFDFKLELKFGKYHFSIQKTKISLYYKNIFNSEIEHIETKTFPKIPDYGWIDNVSIAVMKLAPTIKDNLEDTIRTRIKVEFGTNIINYHHVISKDSIPLKEKFLETEIQGETEEEKIYRENRNNVKKEEQKEEQMKEFYNIKYGKFDGQYFIIDISSIFNGVVSDTNRILCTPFVLEDVNMKNSIFKSETNTNLSELMNDYEDLNRKQFMINSEVRKGNIVFFSNNDIATLDKDFGNLKVDRKILTKANFMENVWRPLDVKIEHFISNDKFYRNTNGSGFRDEIIVENPYDSIKGFNTITLGCIYYKKWGMICAPKFIAVYSQYYNDDGTLGEFELVQKNIPTGFMQLPCLTTANETDTETIYRIIRFGKPERIIRNVNRIKIIMNDIIPLGNSERFLTNPPPDNTVSYYQINILRISSQRYQPERMIRPLYQKHVASYDMREQWHDNITNSKGTVFNNVGPFVINNEKLTLNDALSYGDEGGVILPQNTFIEPPQLFPDNGLLIAFVYDLKRKSVGNSFELLEPLTLFEIRYGSPITLKISEQPDIIRYGKMFRGRIIKISGQNRVALSCYDIDENNNILERMRITQKIDENTIGEWKVAFYANSRIIQIYQNTDAPITYRHTRRFDLEKNWWDWQLNEKTEGYLYNHEIGKTFKMRELHLFEGVNMESIPYASVRKFLLDDGNPIVPTYRIILDYPSNYTGNIDNFIVATNNFDETLNNDTNMNNLLNVRQKYISDTDKDVHFYDLQVNVRSPSDDEYVNCIVMYYPSGINGIRTLLNSEIADMFYARRKNLKIQTFTDNIMFGNCQFKNKNSQFGIIAQNDQCIQLVDSVVSSKEKSAILRCDNFNSQISDWLVNSTIMKPIIAPYRGMQIEPVIRELLVAQSTTTEIDEDEDTETTISSKRHYRIPDRYPYISVPDSADKSLLNNKLAYYFSHTNERYNTDTVYGLELVSESNYDLHGEMYIGNYNDVSDFRHVPVENRSKWASQGVYEVVIRRRTSWDVIIDEDGKEKFNDIESLEVSLTVNGHKKIKPMYLMKNRDFVRTIFIAFAPEIIVHYKVKNLSAIVNANFRIPDLVSVKINRVHDA